MSTGIVRNTGGYQSSGSGISSSSRPSTTASSSASSSSASSSATNVTRNRNLLDSYHDFAMQIFGSNHTQEVEVQFFHAIENGDADRVENLLKRRSHEFFNIDAKDSETGNTPIILAAKLGNLKITQLLLKFGADVTLRNYENETALDVARPNVIRPLLDSVSRIGSSPRHLLQAAWQGDNGTVKRLLSESRILDINCCNVEGFTPLLLVTRDVELFEKFGTMLENHDPLAVIGELLRHRADPVARDSEGKTALHYAASSPCKLAEEIAFTLIQQPALLEVKDNRSLAPIHSASQSGQVEVVLALLDGGADVNERGFAGSTPLHVSAYSGQYQVATTLLDHGADITLIDDSGNTAVDVAKTKRLKTTLKEAWTEATHSKQEVVLNPLRVPSRVGDMSSDERSPRDDVSPREKFMLRKFTDAHKAVLAEEQMLKDIDSGKFPLSPNTRRPSFPRVGSEVKTPIPPRTPRVMEQKPPKTADKTRSPKRSLSFKHNKDEGKGQKVRGHPKLAYTRSDPSSDVNQVPVTVVGLDLDESLRDIRLQRLVQGPVGPYMERQSSQDRCGTRLSQMPQHESNHPPLSSAALTNPSLNDVTDACNEYMKKGRKPHTRRLSNASTDDGDSITSWSSRTKKKSPRKHVINLEQMHLKRSTPSPMSECIRMFPNSRAVLPQSPAVSMGENVVGETIFEFEHESDNLQNSTTTGFFMSSARRLSLGASSHFSNNTWRLPQNVQRSHSILSEEESSPENVEDSQELRLESVNTFNIELSRVSPLKESSDSGQGSSRSTGSQGSSSFSDSTPSPSVHSEQESLVKMSVKNRLGIGMTPAATQVQENTRFNSRLRSYSSRTEEVRDLRRGLVKSVLSTTISMATGVQQLGSIPVEKQPELQPLVSRRDFGELDTIKEGSRQTSANSENLKSRIHSRRASDALSDDAKLYSPFGVRRGSKGSVENTMTVLTDDNLKGPSSMNMLSVLPDVRPESKVDSDKNSKTCAMDDENGNRGAKETVKSDSKNAGSERMVIKKLANSKQNADSSKEHVADTESKESAPKSPVKPVDAKKPSFVKQMDAKKPSPATTSKGSSVSNTLSNTQSTVNTKDTKSTPKTVSESASTVSNLARTSNSNNVMKADSETSRTDLQKTKSAITSKEANSGVVSSNSVTTKVSGMVKSSTRKENTSVGQQKLGGNSKTSQQTTLRSSTTSKPDTKTTSEAKQGAATSSKQGASTNISSQKPDSLLKVTTKVQALPPNKATSTSQGKNNVVKPANATASNKSNDSKGPSKTNSTSPRKLETATSSLTESAPGPNVSKGKPSLTKSFNSNGDRTGVQTELQKAKDEVAKDSSSNTNSSTKTGTATNKPIPNSKVDRSVHQGTKDSKAPAATTSKNNEAVTATKKPGVTAVTKNSGGSESKIGAASSGNETDSKKVTSNVSKAVSGDSKTVSITKPGVTTQANKANSSGVASNPSIAGKAGTGVTQTYKTSNVSIKTATKPGISAKPEAASSQPNKAPSAVNNVSKPVTTAVKPGISAKPGSGPSQPNKTASTANKASAKLTTSAVKAGATPANRTNTNTKLVKQQTNIKKRTEDSKTTTSAKTNSSQNQKENKPKKQKVNNPPKLPPKASSKPAGNNKNNDVDEEEESDVESMEDVEEMFEAVTFVSEDERELEEEEKIDNIVHIEIKSQEEMLAEEPPKVEKKEKPASKPKVANKNQAKKDGKAKGNVKNSTSGKGGKVTVVNGKAMKGTTQQGTKLNKNTAPAKTAKKALAMKTQQNASKSAGQTAKKATLSEKHSLSLENLSGGSPAKKSVVENTPVIEDIMDVIKAVNNGVTPTPWRRSVSVDDMSSPRKKNTTSPKSSANLKTRQAEKASSAPAKGKAQSAGKVTNQGKGVKKQSSGGALKNKDGFSTTSNKKGKGKIKKEQLKDIQLLSESERQTTAFITGQGWQIKTDRNETEDVIINDPLDTTDSSDDEDMQDAALSPRHSLKLQKMNIPSLDPNVLNNLANIMSPLEGNTPRFLPDTMDTIKEFADSLKSNESGEIALLKQIKDDVKNGNSSSQKEEAVDNGEPPVLPPKQAAQTESLDGDGNPPDLPPKLSSIIGPRSEADGGEPPPELPPKENKPSETEPNLPPELPPKQSAVNNNDDLPPKLPPKLMSMMNDHPIKESAVIKEQRTDADGAEDLSLNSYKTNPELLKVFLVPDHIEVDGRGSKSPPSQEVPGKDQVAKMVSNQQEEDKDSEKDSSSDVNQDMMRAIKEDIANKPPLPVKTRSSRKHKPNLRRINSEPTCLLDTSESEDYAEDVFTPERSQNRKASLPVEKQSRLHSPRSPQDTRHSPRSPRDLKKNPENTSLAKYIREKQESGEMLHETHRLEDLKELDEDEKFRKEQILNEHIQDMTISALQEFNSLLSPISEGVEMTSALTRPPSSARDHPEDHLGGPGDLDSLNRSLPMSEVSKVSASTMRSEDVDTLVNELHSSGSISSRGISGSSRMSSERSHSSNTTASEPEGELLHWKKGNLLGRGAFGTVYCGLTSVGQLIAVKQVELSEKDKDKAHKQYETLQEEVQLLKTLRHRNIVGFLGCCLEGSTVNIFMQFIPGGSIASLLARFGALDEPVFCRYTKMILDGTEYLHANNVIHRDIKGANIMLMSNGVIKLIDFGCAKRLCLNMSQSQNNLLKSMRGTPYWMAPEVIMEIGHGKKSDIWSIGCTVFEMATRKPPWAEMPPMPAIFAIGSGEQVPQLPDKFSKEARDFVNSCLTRDQTVRPSATDLLKHTFLKNRKVHDRLRHMSGSSLEESQITFKEQPTNRGDSTGSRGRRVESFK